MVRRVKKRHVTKPPLTPNETFRKVNSIFKKFANSVFVKAHGREPKNFSAYMRVMDFISEWCENNNYLDGVLDKYKMSIYDAEHPSIVYDDKDNDYNWKIIDL